MGIGEPVHRNPHGFKDRRCRRDVRPQLAVTGLERHHARAIHELSVAQSKGRRPPSLSFSVQSRFLE